MHGFLEELGQGVQHVASRVDDLVEFVQKANDARKITGEVSELRLRLLAAWNTIEVISSRNSGCSGL